MIGGVLALLDVLGRYERYAGDDEAEREEAPADLGWARADGFVEDDPPDRVDRTPAVELVIDAESVDMDAAVRNLVTLGATEVEALLAATRAPARLLARPSLGVLAPGAPADIVVLDDGLEVRATLVEGHELHHV